MKLFLILNLNVSFLSKISFLWKSCHLFAVRAGTGGDEAGIWAGDLVGTYWFLAFPIVVYKLFYVDNEI